MRLRWFGQSAFLLTGESGRVLIDPFGDMSAMGRQWDYPPVADVECDLLVITHEHGDHNHAASGVGEPHMVRSQAGTFTTPVGELVSVASEHDEAAGTQRGANTIVCFSLDGLRVAHCGDFGQSALRPEQAAAIGAVDLLFVPVGGFATIDSAGAQALVSELQPRWVVPMHYRTPAIDFLDTADEFLAGFDDVRRWMGVEDTVGGHPEGSPVVLVPAVPGAG